MFGSEGAIASEPIDEIGWSSKTEFHVTPPSVDFHTPPDAVAAQYVVGSPGTPAARETRPPAAGPMRRYLSALNSLGALGSAFGASCAAAVMVRRTAMMRAERSLAMVSMAGILLRGWECGMPNAEC